MAGATNTETELSHTVDNGHLNGGVLVKGNSEELIYEGPLALNQDGTEFRVERFIAKGRIDRREWFKVKRDGYPDSGNSWEKRNDIGEGAIRDYDGKHAQGQDEFQLDRLVSKRQTGEVTQYEVMWRGPSGC